MSRSSGRGGAGARRRTPAAKGGGRGKGRSRLLGALIALLALVVLAGGGLAAYLGFLPHGLFGGGPGEGALATDSSVTASAGTGRDSTLAAPVADSGSAGTFDGATAGTAATAVTQADSAAGDAIYHGAGRCVGCHGAAAEGVAALGPRLRDSVPRVGDGSLASIARVVAGGAPPGAGYRIAMPAYGGQLTTDDVSRVSAYVFAIARPGRTTADTSGASGTVPRSPPPGETVNADAPATAPAGSPAPMPASPSVQPAPLVRRPTVPAPPSAPPARRP